MKTIRLLALVVLTALPAAAQQESFAQRYGAPGKTPTPAPKSATANYAGIPFAPYRKVGEKFYDLNPIYKWLATPGPKPARPMPEWIGTHSSTFKVVSVLSGGILVREEVYTPSGGRAYRNPVYLVNYPGSASLIDDQTVHFLALRDGSFQYTSVSGARETVAKYDYGTPYNPWALAAERSKTNAPAIKKDLANQ